MIILELNAAFDLTLYALSPGDEVFVPTGLFPNLPASQKLATTLSWAKMKLTKSTKRMIMKKGENDEDKCNDTVGYVYGGIFKMIYEKFCMILALNISS